MYVHLAEKAYCDIQYKLECLISQKRETAVLKSTFKFKLTFEEKNRQFDGMLGKTYQGENVPKT